MMRKRRIAKWAGLVLCGLILAGGVASMWIAFGFGDYANIGCGRLAVHLGRFNFSNADAWVMMLDCGMERRLRGAFSLPEVSHFNDFSARGGAGVRFMLIPLWLPLALATMPTAFLWHRRRIPPGHCQRCGYDLTGNVSGRCPECGKAI